jgi:hypothetical protein
MEFGKFSIHSKQDKTRIKIMPNNEISVVKNVPKTKLSESTDSVSGKNQKKPDLEKMMAIYPGLTREQAVNPWIGFGI